MAIPTSARPRGCRSTGAMEVQVEDGRLRRIEALRGHGLASGPGPVRPAGRGTGGENDGRLGKRMAQDLRVRQETS